MLYRVIISNYKSFDESSEFNMFPNLKRINFSEHLYHDGVLAVLKLCAIYGANGSGKSNFINALSFLKKTTTQLPSKNEMDINKSWYSNSRFRLPVKEGNEPISFVIEFSINSIVYIYLLEIDYQGVKTEKLLISGKGVGDNVPIFERNNSDLVFNSIPISDDIKEIFVRQIRNDNFLSVIAINGKQSLTGDVHLANAYQWFNEKLDVIMMNRQIPWLIDYYRKKPKALEFVNDIFSNIGLGLKDLKIKDSLFEEWIEDADVNDKEVLMKLLGSTQDSYDKSHISMMSRSFPVNTIMEENGRKVVFEFLFNQFGKNGFVGGMDTNCQSDGTLRLLTLLPAIWEAITDDKTVVIDEIDNSIHPLLMKNLIRYFGSNNTNGQLIFTTHETALLNQQELLRTDEVWLMEKNEGATKMYSLNDFKIHNTISIENGYLQGRYGAIPFIGSFT